MVAVALIGVPLLIIGGIALLWGGQRTVALFAALAVYTITILVLARLTGLPIADARPTRTHYLIATAAGAAGGLAFGLVATGTLGLRPILSGAIYAVGWWWFGKLLREPFGGTPWPPYAHSLEHGSSETAASPDPGQPKADLAPEEAHGPPADSPN